VCEQAKLYIRNLEKVWSGTWSRLNGTADAKCTRDVRTMFALGASQGNMFGRAVYSALTWDLGSYAQAIRAS
jgi:hypothetical protein